MKFFTQKYSNIIIESNDVLTDFTIMKNAKILVCSCSTLSWAAALLSTVIEKAFDPNYKQVHGPHQTFKKPIEKVLDKFINVLTCPLIPVEYLV